MNKISSGTKKIISSLLIAVMIIALVPVSSNAAPSKYVKSLTVAKSATVVVGKTVKVKATAKVKGGASKYVKASSSNTKVATVSVGKPNSKGVSTLTVKGKKKGTATITVKTKGKNAKGKVLTKKIKVTVKNAPKNYVKSLTLSNKSVAMKKGKSVLVTASVSTVGNVSKGITASSSDTGIANVSVDGTDIVIKGKKKGTATVTVKTKGIGSGRTVISKAISVKVKDTATNTADNGKDSFNKVTSLYIGTRNADTVSGGVNLTVGEQDTKNIYVNYNVISYNNPPTGKVKITSSNTNVVSVSVGQPNSSYSSVMTLTAKAAGSPTITVKTTELNAKGKYVAKKFTVNAKDKVVEKEGAEIRCAAYPTLLGPGVSLSDVPSDTMGLAINTKLGIKTGYTTTESRKKGYGYSAEITSMISNDESVAKVISAGEYSSAYDFAVAPVGVGSTTITVTLAKKDDNGKNLTASIPVKVVKYLCGEDSQGRPLSNKYDECRFWQIKSYADIDYMHDLGLLLTKTDPNTGHEYYVRESELTPGAKAYVQNIIDDKPMYGGKGLWYIAKIEPEFDGARDYWYSAGATDGFCINGKTNQAYKLTGPYYTPIKYNNTQIGKVMNYVCCDAHNGVPANAARILTENQEVYCDPIPDTFEWLASIDTDAFRYDYYRTKDDAANRVNPIFRGSTLGTAGSYYTYTR